LALTCLAGTLPALCGDCDLDGDVDVLDALDAARHGIGLTTLVGAAFDNCDVQPDHGNGEVNVLDALPIAQFSVGIRPALLCAASPGCAPATPDPVLLDTVVSYVPGPLIDPGRADPIYAVNGVLGGGCCAGSLDVCSLGSDSVGWGGHLTLRRAGRVITNGPGADFVVYENPFWIAGSPEGSGFYETGIVEVSMDGVAWVTFPVVFDPAYPVDDRRRYVEGFCGVEPVTLRTDLGQTPGDPAGGGDAFDLDDVGLCEARYIRIRDTAQVYPDANFPPGDCDIDGIAALYTRPDP
jgi:hypothetical protein